MIPAAEVILLMPQDVAPLRFRQGGGQVDLGPEQAHDECSWSIKKHYKTSNEAALLCRNKAATTFPDISSVVVAVFL